MARSISDITGAVLICFAVTDGSSFWISACFSKDFIGLGVIAFGMSNVGTFRWIIVRLFVFVVTGLTERISMSSESSELSDSLSEVLDEAWFEELWLGGDLGLERKLMVSSKVRLLFRGSIIFLVGVLGLLSLHTSCLVTAGATAFIWFITAGVSIFIPGDLIWGSALLGSSPIFIFSFVIVFCFSFSRLGFFFLFGCPTVDDLMTRLGLPFGVSVLMNDE